MKVVLAIAGAYSELHELRPAAQAYEIATGTNPGSSAAWYGLAISALSLIEQDGETLAVKHGDSTWARMLYADELLTQHRPKEAIHIYEETSRAATATERAKFFRVLDASTMQPPLANALSPETLTALRQTLQPVSEGDLCAGPGAALQNASCAFLGGDYARSAEMASASLATDPSDVEALYWSVKANEQRAVLAFSRFESLAPQSPATFDLTGDLYRRRSMPEQARADYAKALAVNPHDAAALLGTAAAHLTEGHLEEALTTATAGLAARPDDPRLNRIAGEALVAQHRFAEARPCLDRSFGSDANSDAHVHALLGRIAAEEGQTERAIAEMRLGLRSDRDGSLHFQLYRLLRKTGDLAGAQEAEAGARALQAQRLQHAAVALDESQPPQN